MKGIVERVRTLHTKIIDIVMIHKFFIASKMSIWEKLKQLPRSYLSTLTNRNFFLYLSSSFYINDNSDPVLMLTYPNEITFLGKSIKNFHPANVIDIGANIGQWGRTFKFYYPNSSIYSFEPSPKTFHILKKNSEDFHHWFVFNYAIGNPKDNILYLSKYGSAEHSLVKTKSSFGKMKIKTTILDTNQVPKNIDLLKIDVEGYELEVIKYIKELKIKYLSVEVDLKKLDSNLREIQTVIKKYWKRDSAIIGIQKLWSDSPKGNALLHIRD